VTATGPTRQLHCRATLLATLVATCCSCAVAQDDRGGQRDIAVDPGQLIALPPVESGLPSGSGPLPVRDARSPRAGAAVPPISPIPPLATSDVRPVAVPAEQTLESRSAAAAAPVPRAITRGDSAGTLATRNRYELDILLEPAKRRVQVSESVTWTNSGHRATDRLVFQVPSNHTLSEEMIAAGERTPACRAVSEISARVPLVILWLLRVARSTKATGV